jgi:hypothetical protein
MKNTATLGFRTSINTLGGRPPERYVDFNVFDHRSDACGHRDLMPRYMRYTAPTNFTTVTSGAKLRKTYRCKDVYKRSIADSPAEAVPRPCAMDRESM